jgi:hypothetical protein
MFLDIRRSGKTWIFDDAVRGVVAEPFVNGIPEMLDWIMYSTWGRVPLTARIYFSNARWPGATHQWVWVSEDSGGNWYRDPATGRRGWLCPCLGKYFETAPSSIYLQVQKST